MLPPEHLDDPPPPGLRKSNCSASPQNFVTCALGIHYIGFVMMCFAATNSISSFLFGRLARYTGRAALMCLGKPRPPPPPMNVLGHRGRL